ncbi:MAG: transglutaminase family protein [Chthoniobacteraceae bacterium]
MPIPKPLADVAAQVDATFAKNHVKLTLGGEPTYVPLDPVGAEWSITALGPTKLRYAHALVEALIADSFPNAVAIFSPGKYYPGEVNPRWALNLVWKRDGSPFVPSLAAKLRKKKLSANAAFKAAKLAVIRNIAPRGRWLRGIDPHEKRRPVAVLPLDHDGKRFLSANWRVGDTVELSAAEGPAGLRLPLHLVPAAISRRALTLEIKDGKLHVFLPPLLQVPELAVIESIVAAVGGAKIIWEGYVPPDEAKIWEKLGIASDPGVLEINLPPCAAWREYAHWMDILERTTKAAGLRSFKQHSTEDEAGTGGGNHLLFGGPSLDENPLFTHPRWVTSILRYWQHHPSLAYLFTGIYVGPSSQAPRPDECVSSLYDLEMAYQFLETLPDGDHRYLISETLRHLHTDSSGNTHRSESSFDKFWNVNFEGGCRGLVEFRAVESLPHATWMSAIALLWHTLAAYLLEHPCTAPLVAHGDKLHDYYYLPAGLWADFESILADLHRAGFHLPPTLYRAIMEWRFPVMLEFAEAKAALTIRKAHEGWPLLCEQPLEGGNTSRFVDTSIERLEFIANKEFAAHCEVRVQGRPLPLEKLPHGEYGVGLRYRRTALYPSLHPGIPPQMPLLLTISRGRKKHVFKLEQHRRKFLPTTDHAPAATSNPCRKLNPDLVTCDLRIP